RALDDQRLVVAVKDVRVVVDPVRQRADEWNGGDAAREIEVVLDELRRAAPRVGRLRVSALAELAAESDRELAGQRRSNAVAQLDVRGGEIRIRRLRVVGQVESRGEVEALAGGAGVAVVDLARTAHVRVRRELHLIELSGIVRIRRIEHGAAVALQIVARAQPGDDGLGIDGANAAGRLAADRLEPRA